MTDNEGNLIKEDLCVRLLEFSRVVRRSDCMSRHFRHDVVVIYFHIKNLVWVKLRDYAISPANPILILRFLVSLTPSLNPKMTLTKYLYLLVWHGGYPFLYIYILSSHYVYISSSHLFFYFIFRTCTDRYHVFLIETRVFLSETLVFSMFIGNKKSLLHIYDTCRHVLRTYGCPVYLPHNHTFRTVSLLRGYHKRNSLYIVQDWHKRWIV